MIGNSCKVCVGNLKWQVTDDDLLAFLAPSSNVLSARVQRHSDSDRSKGWGLVEFADSESAADAIAKLNFTELQGRKVHVRYDRLTQFNGPAEAQVPGVVYVYIGNLPWEITAEHLITEFHDYGPIDCDVMTNMLGRSRGFALMGLPSLEIAERFISEKHHCEFVGRPLEIRLDKGPPASKPKRNSGKTSVFVGGIESCIDEITIQEIFSQRGTILTVNIFPAKVGKDDSKWGLVEYSSAAEAQAAIATYNGYVAPPATTPFIVRLDRKGRIMEKAGGDVRAEEDA